MSARKRELRVNAFYGNTPGQNWVGLWSHPRSRALDYKNLNYWIEVAQLAERGKLDGIFLADANGVYDVFAGNQDAAIEKAVWVPVNDPFLLVPSMAHATKHLGIAVTGNVSYEAPYAMARRFSTLDHLTDGRVGWNIVTGFQDSAARAMGLNKQRAHDDRYDFAEEYMDIVYKLWEGSWEDGAVVHDRENRIFARPELVHSVSYEGKYLRMSGAHLCEPSLQRTPVLYQAGGSSRGRAFAAKHAECVFLTGLPKKTTAERVRDIRKQAAALGRDPNDLLFLMMATIVVAPTEAEAFDKRDELQRYVDVKGMLAMMSGLTALDFSTQSPDDPIAKVETNAMRALLEGMTTANRDRVWRIRDIANFGPQGGRECFIVGSPTQVADELESWMEEADIDGFNLHRSGEPGHLEDFVNLVVPELQNRGIYKTEYRAGTFREKLFGKGDRLSGGHPATGHRRLGGQ